MNTIIKNKFTLILSGLIVLLLTSCDTNTFEDIQLEEMEITNGTTITFQDNIQPITQARCVVCHSSGGSASFYPLTNYTEVSTGINNIINRIQLPNGDPLKMPAGGTLSNNQIDLFIEWRNNGLIEN